MEHPSSKKNSKRVIVYLRHGEDKKSHHKYDERLTDQGKEDSKRLAKKLINKYGIPDVIYCSPFYRTRQTRRQMLKVINKYSDQTVENIIEPRLSRFFTDKEKRNPDIRSDTRENDAPLDETYDEFKDRIEEHLNEVEKNDKYDVIWCIGHTLIIKHVARLKNIDRDEHIEYLDTIIIKKTRKV